MDDNAMTGADERRRLMGELELERNQLIRNIETCRIRDIDRPFIGEWSLKDIVGHVASWEAEVVSAFRDLREERRPQILDFDQASLDRWNQDHVERKRNLNFWSMLEQLRGGRDRLVEELAEVSDETFGARDSVQLHLVQGIVDHDRSHWHEIAARLAGIPGARPTGPTSVAADAAAVAGERGA